MIRITTYLKRLIMIFSTVVNLVYLVIFVNLCLFYVPVWVSEDCKSGDGKLSYDFGPSFFLGGVGFGLL
jgi:hypothetical protein